MYQTLFLIFEFNLSILGVFHGGKFPVEHYILLIAR